MMKIKKDNNVTNHIGLLYTEKKSNYHERFDRVWSTMKSKQENNVIDCIGVIFIEIETELSWPIR